MRPPDWLLTTDEPALAEFVANAAGYPASRPY